MTFEIQEAKRQGARLLIQLSGVSGSGKTYTALQLAYGLAGNDGTKIIGIDTENRRMSLNAEILPNGAKFRTLDFYAPFSPARYIEAIQAACKAGAEVIVIDSVTHEWESEGGCEDIAHATNSRIPDWKKAKAEHKKFMTYMLQCPAHIIACTRAREKVEVSDHWNEEKRKKEKVFIPLGLQPIQEKNFSYEATVSLMMQDQGKSQQVLKCPSELQSILGRGTGYITADEGLKLRQWIDGAVPIDPAIEQARGTLLNISNQGILALERAWRLVPDNIRQALGPDFKASIIASAKAYDQSKIENRQGAVPDPV